MSKKNPDLQNFFKQNTKKTTKKTAKPVAADAAEDAEDAQVINADAQEQPTLEESKVPAKETSTKKKVDFLDNSDDDEEKDLGDEFKGKIRTKAEVDAENRKKELQEEDNSSGFGLKASSNMFDRSQAPIQATAVSSSAAADSSGMKFGVKPTFFNKAKVGNLLNKGEFPELGSFSEVQDKKPTNQEGKSGNAEEVASFNPFMSSAARPMGEGFSGARRDEDREDRDRRPAAAKPIFTSSKGGKKNIGGGAELTEIANSKQNYDMSFLGSSAKPAFVAGEGQAKDLGQKTQTRDFEERPRNKPFRQDTGNSFARNTAKPDDQFDDSDFTVVTEKKRVMGNFGGSGDINFGKPTFGRGGQ